MHVLSFNKPSLNPHVPTFPLLQAEDIQQHTGEWSETMMFPKLASQIKDNNEYSTKI